jgi:hypothetical protein
VGDLASAAGLVRARARSRQDVQRVQTVMRDSEELAGLLAGQMDRQAARLERLLTEADAKIRELEKLSARPAATPMDDERIDPLNLQVYELADEGCRPSRSRGNSASTRARWS